VVELLLADNQKIMQSMLQMMQMMLKFQEQMQWNMLNSRPQDTYQYHQPIGAGNWVYYPQGFQSEMNVFQAPPMPQIQSGPAVNSGWNAQPEIPVLQAPQGQFFQPGQFGVDQMSFNFG
jgi:hypothetical protein